MILDGRMSSEVVIQQVNPIVMVDGGFLSVVAATIFLFGVLAGMFMTLYIMKITETEVLRAFVKLTKVK